MLASGQTEALILPDLRQGNIGIVIAGFGIHRRLRAEAQTDYCVVSLIVQGLELAQHPAEQFGIGRALFQIVVHRQRLSVSS
ncbi:hypothetical protein D3C78_1277630 [compost metagenome]